MENKNKTNSNIPIPENTSCFYKLPFFKMVSKSSLFFFLAFSAILPDVSGWTHHSKEIWDHLPNFFRSEKTWGELEAIYVAAGPVKLKTQYLMQWICNMHCVLKLQQVWCTGVSFELITCQCINAAVTRSLEGARKSHSVDIGVLKITIHYNLHYPLSTAHFCFT